MQSVADALQFISYYHPRDYIQALGRAYEREQSPAAKDAIAQILTNSRMCAEGHRPICQDTGIVNVFLKVGMDVRFEGFDGSLEDVVNEGVRRGLPAPGQRAARLGPGRIRLRPQEHQGQHAGRDHTCSSCRATSCRVDVAAKGGGSETKSKFAMLNPSDSIVDWVVKTVPEHGRRLVPARHARHRRRRHRREGDADGQGSR